MRKVVDIKILFVWYESFLVHFVFLKIVGVYRLGEKEYYIFWMTFSVIKILIFDAENIVGVYKNRDCWGIIFSMEIFQQKYTYTFMDFNRLSFT